MSATSQTIDDFLSPVWRDGLFNDLTVFVTGGAGTICSAQTLALVRLGANACIIGRDEKKTVAKAAEIEQLAATLPDGPPLGAGTTLASTCTPRRKTGQVLGIGNIDVRSPEAMADAVKRCVARFGGIDLVIAGAAGNFVAPIARLSPNAFKAVVDIDLLGTFNTVKMTLPHLTASARRHNHATAGSSPVAGRGEGCPSGRGGRIIAMSATFHYTGLPLQSHAAAAKAGVDALMHSVALEYGPRGVIANVISPGPIAGTEGIGRLAGVAKGPDGMTGASAAAQLDPSLHKHIRSGVPIGRWGNVRDIADATVYLFSAAGSFVSGHTLVVDGGAWRRQPATGVGVGATMSYPDYLLVDNKDGNDAEEASKTRRKLKKSKL